MDKRSTNGLDKELLKKVEDLIDGGNKHLEFTSSFLGFCAHLLSIKPKANKDFEQRLRERLLERHKESIAVASSLTACPEQREGEKEGGRLKTLMEGGLEMLKGKLFRQPAWKMATIGALAVVLIAGLVTALPLLTGQQRLALALDPELMASIYFEGMSPALRENLERGEFPAQISPEVEERILQAVPDGSKIAYVTEINGTYHAMVMIEKGPVNVRLAEVIVEGGKVEVIEFDPIPARLIFAPAFRETGAGGAISAPIELGEILIDIPPGMQEKILREVPAVTSIIAAWILNDTYRALVSIEENGEARPVMVILDGDKIEVTDLDQFTPQIIVQWELRRDVLSVTLVDDAARHIRIPQEAQERILQEVGGEIIFAITFNDIYRAVVRTQENGEPKYVQVILEGDKVKIGVAEVEYVEYKERR